MMYKTLRMKLIFCNALFASIIYLPEYHEKKECQTNIFFFLLEIAKLTLLELVMVINVAGHHIE